MRDPDAAAGPHDRVERGGQPAGGADPLDLAVVVAVDVRLAIGDHDQLRPAETGLGDVFEAFLGPGHEGGTRGGTGRESDPQSHGPCDVGTCGCTF